MNVDTGDMGEMADVLRRAAAGEKVIPAEIIDVRVGGEYTNTWVDVDTTPGSNAPLAAFDVPRQIRGTYANKKGAGVVTKQVQTVATFNKQDGTPVVRYGPRKPLREVRRELEAQREKESGG